MSSYSTLPLLLNNQTFVSMKQVNNSSISSGTVLSDTQFEDYICLELAEQNDPVDLSNNQYSLPNSMSIIDSSLNQSTIINNNDTVLVNERNPFKLCSSRSLIIVFVVNMGGLDQWNSYQHL